MIARTLLQTFSTIVTTVVSPHAKEVNYIERVHIDYSVKIMNLIDSRNIYLLLHSKVTSMEHSSESVYIT